MAPRKEVKVDMENRLSCSGIGVVDDSETVLGHTYFTGKSGSGLEDMPDQVVVVGDEP